MTKIEWCLELARLGRLACEQRGDDLRVQHDSGTMLVFADDIVAIYFHPQTLRIDGTFDISVYKQPVDEHGDADCVLSITNGSINEAHRDDEVLKHLRTMFILDSMVG